MREPGSKRGSSQQGIEVSMLTSSELSRSDAKARSSLARRSASAPSSLAASKSAFLFSSKSSTTATGEERGGQGGRHEEGRRGGQREREGRRGGRRGQEKLKEEPR